MCIKIEVLGVNCSKCNMLFLRVNQVVSNYSINAEVIKIEDAQKNGDIQCSLFARIGYQRKGGFERNYSK